ncbi:putative RNA-binding, CRM domain, YhbY-like superfamily [Dioscorea sansibarensis]
MALSTARISELPFHTPIPLCSHPSFSLSLRRGFRFLFSSSASLRTSHSDAPTNSRGDETPRKRSDAALRPKPPSAPWLRQWSPPDTQITEQKISKEDRLCLDRPDGGSTSIERIVHRLRNLGLGLEDGEDEKEYADDQAPLDGEERLSELLQRRWNRPGLLEIDNVVLPWERDENNVGVLDEEDGKGLKMRRVRAPTMAELTIEDSELRRLRRLGATLRERTTVPKAGVTQAVLEKIHDAWRKSELVRLKFHEDLAHDMKTAHEIVERRTGGLVIWRSGSVMVVYRGSNYKRPSSFQPLDGQVISINERDKLFIPDASGADKLAGDNQDPFVSVEKIKPSPLSIEASENMTEEQIEFNRLLDDLGPRFVEWWGTGILPVDADLLPQNIPGYKTPFRLLPNGMRSRLTNSEMTNLRKLARKLPTHFALGRNRNHHGLATAILKLWEKSLVVKIAVKRGIQNTNNKIMAEELKKLTGGILLLRNKFYIVIYRGKDFLPPSVAAALAEREELTKDVQDVEEKTRNRISFDPCTEGIEGHALAGTLAEFQEAQARWGRSVSAEEQEEMREAASWFKADRQLKRIQHKLSIAEAKKLRAERLLAKIEASMVPVHPSDDIETITDEERSVYRRMGLRMKAYLPLGIRGVFDGVIENMHLHWKHRELVKLISKQKILSFVEGTARLLEYESGGILVAIERVPKGFAIIYYRGKNYQRPISIRPRNLLTKAKALKRSVALQRHEALSQHITELEKTIKQMRLDLGYPEVEGENSCESDQIESGYESFKNHVGDIESSIVSENDDDNENFDEFENMEYLDGSN